MKKLLLLALVVFGAWDYYKKNYNDEQSIATLPSTKFETRSFAPSKPNFSCDGRQHCSQMSSYEEAKYFLDHCPNTKMDGDRDGIPCERQF